MSGFFLSKANGICRNVQNQVQLYPNRSGSRAPLLYYLPFCSVCWEFLTLLLAPQITRDTTRQTPALGSFNLVHGQLGEGLIGSIYESLLGQEWGEGVSIAEPSPKTSLLLMGEGSDCMSDLDFETARSRL
jgi:hypothetical protein